MTSLGWQKTGFKKVHKLTNSPQILVPGCAVISHHGNTHISPFHLSSYRYDNRTPFQQLNLPKIFVAASNIRVAVDIFDSVVVARVTAIEDFQL